MIILGSQPQMSFFCMGSYSAIFVGKPGAKVRNAKWAPMKPVVIKPKWAPKRMLDDQNIIFQHKGVVRCDTNLILKP